MDHTKTLCEKKKNVNRIGKKHKLLQLNNLDKFEIFFVSIIFLKILG